MNQSKANKLSPEYLQKQAAGARNSLLVVLIFTVVNLVYNDGVYEVTAWREVPGGLVLVSVSSYDYLPDVEAVLSGIEIIE